MLIMPFSRAARLALACAAGLLAPGATTQETPTERESARGVVLKMDSLQRSLDIAGLVSKLTAPNAARDAVAARAKQLMDGDLLALGDDITRHPEIGFEEKRSVDLLKSYLEK